jgi:hypothetical protein
MIAYVGFDLGIDTSVVTNSFAPKLHLRKPLERNLDAEQDPDMKNVRQLSVVLDIGPHDDLA